MSLAQGGLAEAEIMPLFWIVLAIVLALMLPWMMADVFATALLKLQLRPDTAMLIVAGIFLGSLINIPVKRVVRAEPVRYDPLAVFGLRGLWTSQRQETVVAVNVGGCLIPTCLALYEVVSLVPHPAAVGALAVACAASVWVCYKLARPVDGVGITMPTLVPAIVACGLAILLAPAYATPVAFVAGVAGPLIGADLMHVRDFGSIGSGVVSIGGAGTFDGILLTGILALYLA
jgi:uncharacterized membrane protein